MLIRKWIVLCTIFLIFSAKASLAQENKDFVLSLEGSFVGSEIGTVEKNGTKFVNLAFLHKFFRIATSWSTKDNQLYFKFGNLNFKFYSGKTTYYVNGSSRTLSVAPFDSGGDFWLPLDFLVRLGLAIKSESKDKVALEWSKNYLLGVDQVTYQNQPAFELIGTKNLTFKTYTLNKPERLVCEIANSQPHFTVDAVLKSKHSYVKKIRIKKGDNGSTLVIFELKKNSTYQVLKDPDQPNTAAIVFNYFVEEVRLSTQDKQTKISISTSAPANYQVTQSDKRMVVKFSGAIFQEKSKTILNPDNRFRSIKIEQHADQIVTVTFELATNDEYFLKPSRSNPNLLEVVNTRTITAVQWSKTASGSTLTVTGDGELSEKAQMIETSKCFQLDFEHTKFAPGVAATLPTGDQADNLSLSNVNDSTVRIQIDFKLIPSYQISYSDDHHQLTVRFTDSTIVGKVIVLDPGHGGYDNGASGKKGTREKDINLEVALRLKNLLEKAGAEVIMTRNDDTFISLYERCYFANNHKANLFISIHTNSHPDPAVHGIEVFYYDGREKSGCLAEKVYDKIIASTKLSKQGVKTAHFVVIRETQMPSILVELGFLSNSQEENTLRSSDFKDKAALGIMQGIIDYY